MKSQKEQYEPFRSQQRQQIIEAKLFKMMNLKELQASTSKNKIIDCYYKMHTLGGVLRIEDKWLKFKDKKFYWPPPLCFIRDFVTLKENSSFESLTGMRQYLGEKITFYFAWKSFLTCYLLFLSLPGVLLQIYIIVYDEWTTWLIPIWVFYTIIWNSVTLEFWKRKTSEINFRWGSIKFMTKTNNQKTMRDDFIGDENVNEVTGELTKKKFKGDSTLYQVLQFPVLILLGGSVIVTFLALNIFKNIYAENANFQILGSIIQGIIITVLNVAYTLSANFVIFPPLLGF